MTSYRPPGSGIRAGDATFQRWLGWGCSIVLMAWVSAQATNTSSRPEAGAGQSDPSTSANAEIPANAPASARFGPSLLAALGLSDQLLGWLLGQPELQFEVASVQLGDGGSETGSPPVTVSDLSIEIKNDRDDHHFNINGLVHSHGSPERPGRFALTTRIYGDPRRFDWRGTVSLDAQNIDIANLGPHLRGVLGLSAAPLPSQGYMNLKFESDWRDGKLADAQVEFRVEDLRFADQKTPDGLVASTRLHITADNQGWRISVKDALFEREGATYRPPPFQLAAGRPDAARGDESLASDPRLSLHGELPSASVQELFQGLALIQGLGNPADRAFAPFAKQIRGYLTDLRFSWLVGASLGDMTLAGKVSGLSLPQDGWWPGFEIERGTVRWAEQRGAVQVDRGQVTLDRGQSFPSPRQLDVNGTVSIGLDGDRWQALADGLKVQNDDVALSVYANYRWPIASSTQSAAAGGPEYSVNLTVERARVPAFSDYMPRDMLPTRLADWLEGGLRAGSVESGSIQLRSDQGADGPIVVAEVQVVDGILDYADGWPMFTDIETKVAYHPQTGIVVAAKQGNTHDVKLQDVVVTIAEPGADQPVLTARGTAHGDTANGARFLRESPLAPQLEHFLDNVPAQGPASLDLALHLELADSIDVARVDGNLSLRQNQLGIPGLTEGLDEVNGTLLFDAHSVQSKDLTARYLGRPLQVAVATRPEGAGTRIELTGKASARYLASHLTNAGLIAANALTGSELVGRMRGESRWSATVEVPVASPGRQPRVTIDVRSNLRGATLRLPAPLGKRAEERRSLQVKTRFVPGGGRRIAVRYADLAAANMQLRRSGSSTQIQRGTVALGTSQIPNMPADAAVEIAGQVGAFDADAWFRLMATIIGASKTGNRTTTRGFRPDLGPVDKIDVLVEQLRLFQVPIEGLRIHGNRDQQGRWVVSLVGPNLIGEVVVPKEATEQGIRIDFERLKLQSPPPDRKPRGAATARIDPRNLPPIRLTCSECALGEHRLGVVKFNSKPIPNGLRIDNLYVLGTHFEASASGSWTRNAGQDRSQAELELHSSDLGQLAQWLGYTKDTTSGGAADILINAQWPGALTDVTAAGMKGVLHLRASDGNLLAVSPGTTGRIFGLLMLPSLPRRLILDFSDLFSAGLAYDLMEGSFDIADGHAHTNNFLVDSASARIEVSGRTGLVDETYDQLITVTPKLSSSIPLAPIWLAEKLQLLRDRTFDNAFAQQYRVTGTWAKPKIEVLRTYRESPDDAFPSDR